MTCHFPDQQTIAIHLNIYHENRGEVVYEEWGLNNIVAAKVAHLVFFPETIKEDIEDIVHNAIYSYDIIGKNYQPEGLKALERAFFPPIKAMANEIMMRSNLAASLTDYQPGL